MDRFTAAMRWLGKTFAITMLIIVAATVAGIIFGLVVDKRLTFSYFFIWNYFSSAVVIIAGAVIRFGMGPERRKSLEMGARIPMASMLAEANSDVKKKNPRLLVVGLISMAITIAAELITSRYWF